MREKNIHANFFTVKKLKIIKNCTNFASNELKPIVNCRNFNSVVGS